MLPKHPLSDILLLLVISACLHTDLLQIDAGSVDIRPPGLTTQVDREPVLPPVSHRDAFRLNFPWGHIPTVHLLIIAKERRCYDGKKN